MDISSNQSDIYNPYLLDESGNIVLDASGNPIFIPQPLKYQDISGVDLSGYTNMLLINRAVADYQDFVTYANPETFPVVFSMYSTREELLALVAGFSNLSRIGLVFETNDNGRVYPFLNREAWFLDSDLEGFEFSSNMQFMIRLIQTLGITNIDYLACNTLVFNNWKSYYSILTDKTGVVVGASDDKTGNIKYGGDWVLESTGEDVEKVYFTSGIEYYTYLLANAYTYGNTVSNGVDTTITTSSLITASNVVLYRITRNVNNITNNAVLLGGGGTGGSPASSKIGNDGAHAILIESGINVVNLINNGSLTGGGGGGGSYGGYTNNGNGGAGGGGGGGCSRQLSSASGGSGGISSISNTGIGGGGGTTCNNTPGGGAGGGGGFGGTSGNGGGGGGGGGGGNVGATSGLNGTSTSGGAGGKNATAGVGGTGGGIGVAGGGSSNGGGGGGGPSGGAGRDAGSNTAGGGGGAGISGIFGGNGGFCTNINSGTGGGGAGGGNGGGGAGFYISGGGGGSGGGKGGYGGSNAGVGGDGGVGIKILGTGSITNLYNSQNLRGRYGPLYIGGNAPTNYFITILGDTSYGQLFASPNTGLGVTGSVNFGINTTSLSIFSVGVSKTYNNVLSRITPTKFSDVINYNNTDYGWKLSANVNYPTINYDLTVNIVSLRIDISLNSTPTNSLKVVDTNGNTFSPFNVSYGTTDISLTYLKQDPTTILDLSVNGVSYRSISSPFDISRNLIFPDTSLNFTIYSSDRSFSQSYAVTVHTNKSSQFSSFRLKNTSIGLDTSINFVNDSSYITIPYTDDVSGTYVTVDPNATVRLNKNNGGYGANLTSPFDISGLVAGDNSLNLLVSASDGNSTKTYTLGIRIQPSDKVNDLFLYGRQVINHGNYIISSSIDISSGISDISGNYSLVDSRSNMNLSVNGLIYSNIGSSFNVPGLVIGDNSLNFTVNTYDGSSSRNYDVNVHVLKSNKFTSLTLNNQSVTFDASYNSNISVPYGTKRIAGNYTTVDPSAFVDLSVNSTYYHNLNSSFDISLNLKNNALNFLVTASDRLTSQNYYVNVVIEASCLLEGTLVWSDRGYVPIETLQVGDSIQTQHYYIAITKIGKWTVDLNKEEDRQDLSKKMYKIPAGRYGATSDVFISHYHRFMYEDGEKEDNYNRLMAIPEQVGLFPADPSEYTKDGKYTLYHLEIKFGNHYMVNGGCRVEAWKSTDKYF